MFDRSGMTDIDFRYRAASGASTEAFEKIRTTVAECWKVLDAATPDGREKSIARTHFETAHMWINRAIVVADPLSIPQELKPQ